MKIILDQFKDVQILVSGSPTFEINNKLSDPLTVRKWECQFFPISLKELEKDIGYLKSEQQLELRLLYGMYPDVINNPGDEVEVLKLFI